MKHIFPILTLVFLLAAGCGGTKNLPANVKTQSHSDGYVTDETIGVQHIDMIETEEMTYQSFEDYVRTHVSGVDVGSDGSLIIRGISSSTTTYIIAPAAKASVYGMMGTDRKSVV